VETQPQLQLFAAVLSLVQGNMDRVQTLAETVYWKVKGQGGVPVPGTKVTWMVLSSCFSAAFSLRMASKYHMPQHFMSCSGYSLQPHINPLMLLCIHINP